MYICIYICIHSINLDIYRALAIKPFKRKEEMMAEIKKEAVELSILGVSKFLDGNINTEENRSFIEKIIKNKV